ncbi:hypothetical protein N9I89_03380 [Porticoccaceae bacterium]|nr:hypothetical protein [Porticoccaceae bacterium]
MPTTHCINLNKDFHKKLPAGSKWDLYISGLDCDMAELKVVTSAEDFPALLSAAGALGRNYATEANTSATPPTKTLKWTQRLYSRNASDLGIKAKLKKNYTGNCVSCSSSTRNGGWSGWDTSSCNPSSCGEYKTRTCDNPSPYKGGKECERDQTDNSLTMSRDRDERKLCDGMSTCGQWVKQANCPTNTCVQSLEDRQTKSICRNNPCKLDGATTVAVGSTKTCNTPRCGTWEKNDQCAITHCLNSDEKDPEKPKCEGNAGEGCINDQGILVTVGTKEMCQLPDCTKPNKIDKCPDENECQTDGKRSKEKFICKGARCKKDTSRFGRNDEWSEECPSRPCSKLTDWNWVPPASNNTTCLNKGDTQPKKIRKCKKYENQTYHNFGCRDDKGAYVLPGDHVKKVILRGCAYWGKWSDETECMVKYDERNTNFYGEKTQKRKCYRHNSNGEDKVVKPKDCFSLDNGGAEREMDCYYEWGKWIKENQCPDNCVTERQKQIVHKTCNGGTNDAFCNHETSTKRYIDGQSITCGEVKPECGTWGKWSACKFEGNEGYGSCDKKDGIKTRECSEGYCKGPEGLTGNKTDTLSCYSEKCQINIDNNIDKQISIDGLVKVDTKITNKDVKIIISKNSYFSATKRQECAIQSLGKFKKLRIINFGIITGYSGEGGAGAKPKKDHDRYFSDDSEDISEDILEELDGEDGEDGGSAICIGNEIKDFKVENHGIIKGGRAGGGGGGAICYIIKVFFNDRVIEKGCLNGGKGGKGSDPYLPTIMAGSELTIIKDTFVIQSGAGGNGGVLFKEGQGPLKVDKIPRKADQGKQGYFFELDGYVNKEVIIKGKGGYPGVNGKGCTVGSKISDCD